MVITRGKACDSSKKHAQEVSPYITSVKLEDRYLENLISIIIIYVINISTHFVVTNNYFSCSHSRFITLTHTHAPGPETIGLLVYCCWTDDKQREGEMDI